MQTLDRLVAGRKADSLRNLTRRLVSPGGWRDEKISNIASTQAMICETDSPRRGSRSGLSWLLAPRWDRGRKSR